MRDTLTPVRRWRDTQVADWLGYSDVGVLRQLIERNSRELRVRGTVQDAYWLTHDQVMRLCMVADTPRAADFRYTVMQCFMRTEMPTVDPEIARTMAALVELGSHGLPDGEIDFNP